MRYQTIKNRLRLSCLSKDLIQQVFEEMKGISDKSTKDGDGQLLWVRAIIHAHKRGRKMKKSLFNEYEAYNNKGGELSTEIREALDPIIKKWADEGYSVKDIESIAIDNITMSSSVERATRAMKWRKEKIRRSGGTRETREV